MRYRKPSFAKKKKQRRLKIPKSVGRVLERKKETFVLQERTKINGRYEIVSRFQVEKMVGWKYANSQRTHPFRKQKKSNKTDDEWNPGHVSLYGRMEKKW